MFDIIGFWFGVSVITIILLSPLVWVGAPLTRYLVNNITDDDDIAGKARDKVWRTYWDEAWVFGVKMPTFVPISVLVISGLSWLTWLLYNISCERNPRDYVPILDAVSNTAALCVPIFSSIGPVVIIYFIVMWLGRKLWKVNQIVEGLKAKANGHEGDDNISRNPGE